MDHLQSSGWSKSLPTRCRLHQIITFDNKKCELIYRFLPQTDGLGLGRVTSVKKSNRLVRARDAQLQKSTIMAI